MCSTSKEKEFDVNILKCYFQSPILFLFKRVQDTNIQKTQDTVTPHGKPLLIFPQAKNISLSVSERFWGLSLRNPCHKGKIM